jgi:hypothetical protein
MPDTQPTTDQDTIDAAQEAILGASDCYRQNFQDDNTPTCYLMSSRSVGMQIRLVPVYTPTADSPEVWVDWQYFVEPWQDPATVQHRIVTAGGE